MSATGPGSVVEHLQSTLGLSFTGPRRERLLEAVEAQRVAAGLSPEAFLAAVSRPGPVLDRLVAEVTVGETYFFRDRVQCDLLRDVVLPSLADASGPQRRFALWSAGCSSGEEAFTLAALTEAAGLGDRCIVVGSDASRRAIERARAAEYGRWSMRSISTGELATSFVERDGRYHVVDRLRQRTRFVQRNLLDGPPPPGRFDVVLCRNLLIYLTREAVRRVAEVLAGALTPKGWLITAAGDPPLAAPGLEVVRTRYGVVYRRAETPVPRAVDAAWDVPVTRTARPASSASRPPVTSRRPAGPAAIGRTPTPHLDAVASAVSPAEELARQVRELGDAGRLDDASRAAEDAVSAHPLDVELRYLAGVVLLEAGRLDAALSAASRAVYLGPRLAATHLLLGQVQHARGNTDGARRSFRNAARLLAASPAEAPVALTGDMPAGHLAAMASRYQATERGSR